MYSNLENFLNKLGREIKIDILLVSTHPISEMVRDFVGKLDPRIKANLLFDENELSEGDLLFLISFLKY